MDASGTTAYTYDALQRLASVTPPGDATTHFEYDAAGNRTRSGAKSGGAWTAPFFDYAYDNAPGNVTHRITGVTDDTGAPVQSFPSYDPNGHPTQWDPGTGLRTLRWDALGRLVALEGTFVASYAYDPFGRRIEKTEQGATVRYQYDGIDAVAEYDGANALQATTVFGPGIDEPLKVERGGTVAAFHRDALGSVLAVSDVEGPAGADLATYRYEAFGDDAGTTGGFEHPYGFTGRERDASGLYYYRARYYLPEIGRFLTPDPIGLAGGINPYSYVNSNPVNFRDPFGLVPGSAGENDTVPSQLEDYPTPREESLSTYWEELNSVDICEIEGCAGGEFDTSVLFGPFEIFALGRAAYSGLRYGLPALARGLARRGAREAAEELAEAGARPALEAFRQLPRTQQQLFQQFSKQISRKGVTEASDLTIPTGLERSTIERGLEAAREAVRVGADSSAGVQAERVRVLTDLLRSRF